MIWMLSRMDVCTKEQKREDVSNSNVDLPGRRANLPDSNADLPGRRADLPDSNADLPGRRADLPTRITKNNKRKKREKHRDQ